MTRQLSVCLKMCDCTFTNSRLIHGVLDSAGLFKEKTGCMVFPRYFGEATLRPDFVEIIEKQFRLGLTFSNFWFPTDGQGLAVLSDEGWDTLADTGFSWIRLAFHGREEEHDRFMGRKGAWKNLVRTAARADEFGIEWFAVIYLNRDNAGLFGDIRSAVEKIGSPAGEVGWMVPNWQRSRAFEEHRVTIHQLSYLNRERSFWKSEREIIDLIVSDDTLSSTSAFNRFSGNIFLGFCPDGNVYFSGGCHGDPFSGQGKQMLLGSFREHDSIDFFVNKYLEEPPEPVRILSETTWRELADRYGDSESNLVYRTQDLVVNRWGSMHLDQFNLTGS